MGRLMPSGAVPAPTIEHFSHSAPNRGAFWAWFSNEIAPKGVDGLDDDSLIGQIDAQLRLVHPDLGFELWGPDDGVVHFVISADGLLPLFEEVIELVRCAPEMSGWEIVAFRPRRPVAAKIQALDTVISGEQVWYDFEPEDGRLRLALFIDGDHSDNWDMMCAATGVLLEMALGEFDAATMIARLEYCPLTPEIRSLGLKPLRDLADDVDRYFGAAHH
jgi:hypothetical protein